MQYYWQKAVYNSRFMNHGKKIVPRSNVSEYEHNLWRVKQAMINI